MGRGDQRGPRLVGRNYSPDHFRGDRGYSPANRRHHRTANIAPMHSENRNLTIVAPSESLGPVTEIGWPL